MEKVIATIVIIVLTLGLISYAIIGQMGGFKDTADNVTTEQAKLNAVLENSDVVTSASVKNYVRQGDILGYDVYITANETDNEITLENFDSKIDENVIYSVQKVYESGTSTVLDYIIVTAWSAA